MTDVGAASGALGDGPRSDEERRRRSLAARRYDAYLATVLRSTVRASARRAVSSLRGRLVAFATGSVRRAASHLAPHGTARRELARTLTRRGVRARRGESSAPRSEVRRYRQYYALSRASATQLRSRAALCKYLERHVTVSVVVAAGHGDLHATLGSLAVQVYDQVDVLVASEVPLEVSAPVRCVVADGGIERRTNAAMRAASGEFVLCLLAGDVLEPNAIFDLVVAVQDGHDAAYGDEDRIDEHGEHADGHLKPYTFGKETLYSYDVVGAPLLVARSLAIELGGLDEATSPVAAHDFALRLAARTDRIAHVSGVLLSRPGALDPDPADAAAATVGVVTAAFERLGRHAHVEVGDVLPSVRFVVDPPSPEPSVGIVIPTRDRLDLLEACIASVTSRSTYTNYSIVICDNDSKEEATLRWLKDCGHRVVACPGPFNYASIVNRGVSVLDTEFIVTLNNDTTVATPDWLERLVGLCSLEGVGSVGVKLRYPDGRLQHEGVGIIPMPVHLSRDSNYDTIDRWLTSTRNATAVTGACQIVRAKAWHELDGLDERLGVGYNDVDFGLRLCASGWRVVYTPEVVLGHRESASRGNLHPYDDVMELVARWDLLGAFVDPSMPSMDRVVGGSVGPVVAGKDDGRRRGAHAAPSTPRLGSFARHAADEARAILDDREPVGPLRHLAPHGTARRELARTLTRRGVRARRGESSAPRSEVRRYRQYYALSRASATQLRSRAALCKYLERHVTVSVVVAAGHGDLHATLGSLAVQVYDQVDVLVASEVPLEVSAPVRCVVADGGIERRTNAAMRAASGEFVLCLLAGDVLEPNAIFDLVVAVQDGHDAAYGDEDRIDEHGEHADGHLKPYTFGKETLYSYDVVGAPLLVARSLAIELGGLDEATSPVAAHDFALRLAARTDRIAHVSGVLLSRPGALDPDPADAAAATVGVVTAAFERLGRHAHVEVGDVLPSVRFVVDPPSPEPSVGIVIPTRDRLDLLEACIASVTSRSTYTNYSIVICDNDSKEEATLRWLKDCGHRVVACPGPFNYASIVNRGVSVLDTEFIVTLNNDTTVATPDWLERLVGLCSLEGVGSVGVKLRYPDGRLQHEGVGIIPMPVHLSRDSNYDTIDRWLTSTRNATAVTGACQIVRAKAWHELDGLDEQLAVAFNDVDFGMRLCASGWRVVYTPEVVLGHRESASRGDLHPPADEALLVARWDLLGGFVDPSMPSVLDATTGVVVLVAAS